MNSSHLGEGFAGCDMLSVDLLLSKYPEKKVVELCIVSLMILSIETELCYPADLSVFETKIDTSW